MYLVNDITTPYIYLYLLMNVQATHALLCMVDDRRAMMLFSDTLSLNYRQMNIVNEIICKLQIPSKLIGLWGISCNVLLIIGTERTLCRCWFTYLYLPKILVALAKTI